VSDRVHELEVAAVTDDAWKTQTAADDPNAPCYEQIKQRLGYRFSLKQVNMNLNANPGGVMHVEAVVTNFGFSKVTGQRPVFGVLRCDDWDSPLLPLFGVDARLWKPGQVTQFVADISIQKRRPKRLVRFF
jgi:hypothetical protein